MIFLVAVILLTADFFISTVVKNLLNGLPWSHFPLWYTGNMIGIFVNSLILVFFSIVYFRPRKKEKNRSHFLLLILLVGILFLLAGYGLMTTDTFAIKKVVFWDYQLSYVLPGVFFTLHYLVLLGVLSYLWLQVFRTETMFTLRLISNVFYGALLLTGFALLYSFIASPPLFKEGKVYKTGVVLGAAVQKNNTPGSAHKRRLDAARMLLRRGIISEIFLTGSNTPGKISEAEAGQGYLISKGISKELIHYEKKTTSTVEQIRYLHRELLKEVPADKIIIVSDEFHLPRIHQIAAFFNLNIHLERTVVTPTFTQRLYLSSREAVALLIFWLFGI